MRAFRFILLSALLCSGGALAQEIRFFELDNFAGRSFATGASVQNLDFAGFNDRASSAQVRGGSWQVCTDAYFRGRCVTLQPGDYPSLGAMGLSNKISSLREIGWQGGNDASVEGSIVLYESPGLAGRSYTLAHPMRDLDRTEFNDRARSASVRGGTWQLCTDANFQGTCREFGPGQYPNLGDVSGVVSSLRPIRGSGSGGGGWGPGGAGGGGQGLGGGWGGGGGGWGGGARVILYEMPNFSGQSHVIRGDYLANLDNTDFNDRASSVRIERGYWLFCTDANFRGECRTAGPGDYPTMPPGLNNRISSLRRISEEYPYNAPGNWSR
jgi:hypothetical protein